jgi:chaperonin GroES
VFKPVNDRAILRRVESQPDGNASGFVIPETAKEKATECEVVAISPFYVTEYGHRKGAPAKPGDRVLIGKYSGSEHKVGGETLIFVRYDEMLAVDDGAPSAADLDAVSAENALAGGQC